MSVVNVVKATAKLERRLEKLRDRVAKLEKVLEASPGMVETAKDFFAILKSSKYRRQMVKFLKNLDLIMAKLEEMDIRIKILEQKVDELLKRSLTTVD